jgi:hypothetical protein
MTVVETRGRGGQLLGRTCCRDPEITVGRAFDNDVILEDPYVSPHHLRLTKTSDGWQVDDLESLNGLRRDVSAGGAGPLRSGESVRIGNTVLRVYDESHPVDAALELGDAEVRFSVLARHTVWPALIVVSALASLVTGYWSSVEEFKPLAMTQNVLLGVFVMLLIAAFWALLGRLFRHHAYFLAHLSIWLIFGLLVSVVTFIAQWIGYNANSLAVEETLISVLELCVGIFALWCSLSLATNLHGKVRIAAAVSAALAWLSFDVAGDLQFDQDFYASPRYYGRLKGPGLLLVGPAEERVLPDALGALFDEADAEIAEDEEAERG